MHATATSTRGTNADRGIRARWRIVDIVAAAVIGVASGVVFWAWDLVWPAASAPLELLLPGSGALLSAVWLFPAVLGGLVVRKPGAALFAELLAATVEALLGNQWGFQTLLSGLVQGLGAELVFLACLYGIWRLWVAIVAGAASGVGLAILDLLLYYAGAKTGFQLAYVVCAVVSGAVIAGIGSWYLMKALARTGALSRFAAGRTAAA